MSHISGSGSSASDPYIIDELEDLPPLLQNTNNGINHIAFPEVYDGPKVFDMRSKGWFANFINMYVQNPGYSVNKNVYFNGWTILGMSIKDGAFVKFQRDGSSGGGAGNYVLRFYDLIIKNMYIIGITADSFMFRLDASYGVRFFCVRCKISCVLDSQYARTGVFVNTIDEEEFHVTESSLNITFTNTATGDGRRITIINDWHQSRCSFVNTIVSLNSKKWYAPNTDQANSMLRCAKIQFCKFIGDIIVKGVQSAGNGMPLITGLVYSVYNVIDIAVKLEIGSSTALYNDFNGGVHVFDTQHITSNASLTINASNCIKCNDAQMIDKDWLNDRFFIVGENSAY